MVIHMEHTSNKKKRKIPPLLIIILSFLGIIALAAALALFLPR